MARESDRKSQVESLETAQREGRPPGDPISGELDRARAGQESRERDATLEARERGPDAVVRAAAEGERLDVGAADIELVGPIVAAGVAVGRAERQHDDHPGLDG